MPVPNKPAGKPAVPPPDFIDWAGHGASLNGGSADDDRPQWKPELVGDKLTGTITRADRVNTRFGERSVFEFDGCRDVVAGGVALDGGSWMVWATQGFINALAEAEVRLGQTITPELVELIDTGKGNAFRRFEVTEAEASF